VWEAVNVWGSWTFCMWGTWDWEGEECTRAGSWPWGWHTSSQVERLLLSSLVVERLCDLIFRHVASVASKRCTPHRSCL
jgi:hypothetical protein